MTTPQQQVAACIRQQFHQADLPLDLADAAVHFYRYHPNDGPFGSLEAVPTPSPDCFAEVRLSEANPGLPLSVRIYVMPAAVEAAIRGDRPAADPHCYLAYRFGDERFDACYEDGHWGGLDCDRLPAGLRRAIEQQAARATAALTALGDQLRPLFEEGLQ